MLETVLVGLVLMFLLGVGLVLMFLLSVGLVLMFLLGVELVLMFLFSAGNCSGWIGSNILVKCWNLFWLDWF